MGAGACACTRKSIATGCNTTYKSILSKYQSTTASTLPRFLTRKGVPLWRDTQALTWTAQVVSAVLVFGFIYYFIRNVTQAASGINDISRNIGESAEGANQVSKGINEIATGANEVARNVAEAAAGTTDLNTKILEASVMVTEATRYSKSASSASNACKDGMQELMETVDRISDELRELEANCESAR